MTQEEWKQYPDGVCATPPSELTAISPVSKREPLSGDGAWSSLDSREWTGIRRYLLSPQKCLLLPALHVCSICVELATHTQAAPLYQQKCLGSTVAVLQLFYPLITPLCFIRSPCFEHLYSSFFSKLPGKWSSSACSQLILVAAVKGKRSLAGTETLQGFGSH